MDSNLSTSSLDYRYCRRTEYENNNIIVTRPGEEPSESGGGADFRTAGPRGPKDGRARRRGRRQARSRCARRGRARAPMRRSCGRSGHAWAPPPPPARAPRTCPPPPPPSLLNSRTLDAPPSPPPPDFPTNVTCRALATTGPPTPPVPRPRVRVENNIYDVGKITGRYAWQYIAGPKVVTMSLRNENDVSACVVSVLPARPVTKSLAIRSRTISLLWK